MDRELYLNRFIYTDTSALGDLTWDSGEFECNILEDTCRHRDLNEDLKLQWNEKVWGKTAIPAGRYEIKMEYSKKYGKLMPTLQNVPHYTHIMIHSGNKAEDTLGCLITGDYDQKHPDWVANSKKNFEEFEKKIVEVLAKGRLFISIQGGYTA